MPPRPLRSGDPERVARFALTARLGSGGMGIVYLGEDDDTGQLAALKVIRSDFAAEPEFRARFRREIEAARAVGGACTARLVDADPDAEEPWMATELIPGQSLAETIATRGAMDTPVVVALAAGLAEALSAIHGAGIVHRDLKPGNVILSGDGPKVIDFGIAAAVDATVATRTGVLLGSPGYMAPEQVTGHGEVGPAADVFAWGLTVLYAATGRPPFGTGRADALLYRVVHSEADTDDVPAELRSAVIAALVKEPAGRPSADDLLRGLIGPTDDPATGTRRLLREAWNPPPIDPMAFIHLPTFTPTPDSSQAGDRLRDGDFHDSQTLAGLPSPRPAVSFVTPTQRTPEPSRPRARAVRRLRGWAPGVFAAPTGAPASVAPTPRGRDVSPGPDVFGEITRPPVPVTPGTSASPAGRRAGPGRPVGADERAAAFRGADGSGSTPQDAGEGGAAQPPSAHNRVSGRAMTPWTPAEPASAGVAVSSPAQDDPRSPERSARPEAAVSPAVSGGAVPATPSGLAVVPPPPSPAAPDFRATPGSVVEADRAGAGSSLTGMPVPAGAQGAGAENSIGADAWEGSGPAVRPVGAGKPEGSGMPARSGELDRAGRAEWAGRAGRAGRSGTSAGAASASAGSFVWKSPAGWEGSAGPEPANPSGPATPAAEPHPAGAPGMSVAAAADAGSAARAATSGGAGTPAGEPVSTGSVAGGAAGSGPGARSVGQDEQWAVPSQEWVASRVGPRVANDGQTGPGPVEPAAAGGPDDAGRSRGRAGHVARYPRRTAALAALAAAVAGLAALGAAHAADEPDHAQSRQPAPAHVLRVVPTGGSGPGVGLDLRPSSSVGRPAGAPGGPPSPAAPSPVVTALTTAQLVPLSAVPAFRGTIGQLSQSRQFSEFVTAHNTAVIFLEVLAPGQGNERVFFPGPDPGGDPLPNFTLFASCDAPGPSPGQTPDFGPGQGCTGTTYRLTGLAGGGASFDFAQGFYRLHGYFLVEVVPGMQQGRLTVNLHAVDTRILPR